MSDSPLRVAHTQRSTQHDVIRTVVPFGRDRRFPRQTRLERARKFSREAVAASSVSLLLTARAPAKVADYGQTKCRVTPSAWRSSAQRKSDRMNANPDETNESFRHHLEFTRKLGHTAGGAPTRDNLLVFYLPDEQISTGRTERRQAIERMTKSG